MHVQKGKGEKKKLLTGTSEKLFKRSRSAWLKGLSQRHVALWTFSFVVFLKLVFFFPLKKKKVFVMSFIQDLVPGAGRCGTSLP